MFNVVNKITSTNLFSFKGEEIKYVLFDETYKGDCHQGRMLARETVKRGLGVTIVIHDDIETDLGDLNKGDVLIGGIKLDSFKTFNHNFILGHELSHALYEERRLVLEPHELDDKRLLNRSIEIEESCDDYSLSMGLCTSHEASETLETILTMVSFGDSRYETMVRDRIKRLRR